VLAIAAHHVKISKRRRSAAAPMRASNRQPKTCRHAAALAVALSAALLLAGCGGSSAPAPHDREQIRAVVSSFLDALAHGNGTVACAHATPAGQKAIVSAVGPELQNFDIYGCKSAVYVTGAQMKPASRRALETARIATITLSASSASIPVSTITSPNGNVAIELGTNKPVRLVKSYGVWLIASL
jgi:hypothetical protein